MCCDTTFLIHHCRTGSSLKGLSNVQVGPCLGKLFNLVSWKLLEDAYDFLPVTQHCRAGRQPATFAKAYDGQNRAAKEHGEACQDHELAVPYAELKTQLLLLKPHSWGP